MDCPFCGKEMKEGTIPANNRLQWRDKNFTERVFLSSWTEEAKAFYCPDCRQIVLPVPETAGFLETVHQKIDAASEKIGTVREQWEARRSQTEEQKKKQKQKKEFGSKDPWEL